MKAAVCREFGKPLVIEDVTLRPPGAGEVEVKLAACAICHSDILYASGAWGGFLPAVYGHEAAGHVTGVGAGVSNYAVGDTVLVTLIRSCGHCVSCGAGQPARCETAVDRVHGPLTALDGGDMEQGLQTGAFAEMVVVDHTQLAKIPADMALDAACLLSCGVITGVGAATNTAKIKPGSTVAVIGAGGVGLNAIQGAVICGASRVFAIDLSQEKLDAAREFGATDGVLASAEKPHRIVKEMNGGRGVDYVLVTVGAIQAYQSASRYLCIGGTLVMVGMPPSGEKISVEPVMIAAASHSMTGSNMGDTVLSRDIPWLVSLYQQGRLKFDELVTRRYKLDQINEAIADTVAGNTRRNVIVFD